MNLKINILVLAFCIISIKSFCQTDLLRQKLDSVFQYIDKSQIPNGYLKKYIVTTTPHITLTHCIRNTIFTITTLPPLQVLL